MGGIKGVGKGFDYFVDNGNSEELGKLEMMLVESQKDSNMCWS